MSFWIHGTATDYLDLSNDLVAILENNSVSAAAVNNGGSGYVVGDILTVAGGTALVAAQIEVTSVAAGVVDGVRIYNSGSYSADPTTTANAVTGGSGSGATIDLTMSGLGWTVQRDQVWDGGSEREVIVEGEGDGADSILVGWRTFSNVGSGRYNWELHGMTGYNASGDMDGQIGVSPGFHDAADQNNQAAGAYVLLHNSSIEFWFKIDSYRIIGVFKVGSSYFNMLIGWANRIGTESEYPEPLMVCGHCSNPNRIASESRRSSGLIDPWQDDDNTGDDRGPMLLRFTDGTWYTIKNRDNVSDSSSGTARDRVVVPTGWPQGSSNFSDYENQFIDISSSTGGVFQEIIPYIGLSGTPDSNLLPTPGTLNDDRYVLFPCLIVFTEPSTQVPAEIPYVFWMSAFGSITSEDRLIIDGEVYRIFQNCNRTDTYAHLAIKEI